jgi:hypothetical protein
VDGEPVVEALVLPRGADGVADGKQRRRAEEQRRLAWKRDDQDDHELILIIIVRQDRGGRDRLPMAREE